MFRREKLLNGAFGHLSEWLNNGRADISSGGKVDNSIVTDDLDIIWYPYTVLFQIGTDAPCQAIGVAKDPVIVEVPIMQMFFQIPIDRRLGLLVINNDKT